MNYELLSKLSMEEAEKI